MVSIAKFFRHALLVSVFFAAAHSLATDSRLAQSGHRQLPPDRGPYRSPECTQIVGPYGEIPPRSYSHLAMRIENSAALPLIARAISCHTLTRDNYQCDVYGLREYSPSSGRCDNLQWSEFDPSRYDHYFFHETKFQAEVVLRVEVRTIEVSPSSASWMGLHFNQPLLPEIFERSAIGSPAESLAREAGRSAIETLMRRAREHASSQNYRWSGTSMHLSVDFAEDPDFVTRTLTPTGARQEKILGIEVRITPDWDNRYPRIVGQIEPDFPPYLNCGNGQPCEQDQNRPAARLVPDYLSSLYGDTTIAHFSEPQYRDHFRQLVAGHRVDTPAQFYLVEAGRSARISEFDSFRSLRRDIIAALNSNGQSACRRRSPSERTPYWANPTCAGAFGYLARFFSGGRENRYLNDDSRPRSRINAWTVQGPNPMGWPHQLGRSLRDFAESPLLRPLRLQTYNREFRALGMSYTDYVNGLLSLHYLISNPDIRTFSDELMEGLATNRHLDRERQAVRAQNSRSAYTSVPSRCDYTWRWELEFLSEPARLDLGTREQVCHALASWRLDHTRTCGTVESMGQSHFPLEMWPERLNDSLLTAAQVACLCEHRDRPHRPLHELDGYHYGGTVPPGTCADLERYRAAPGSNSYRLLDQPRLQQTHGRAQPQASAQ